MNQATNDIDLIERYFDNLLSTPEADQLKSRLSIEPDLKKLFDQENLLVNTIRYQAASNNLAYLKQLEQSLGNSSKSHFRSYWFYYAAASIILFIMAGMFIFKMEQEPADLYAAYFEPYPNIFEPTLRGSGSLVPRHAANPRAEAFQAYEAGDYEKAIELFSTLLQQKEEPELLLLCGNANLALNRTAAATQNFNNLIARYDHLDMQGKWFLSLCYLKEGKTDEARQLLEQLGNTEISYAIKAKELLKKVD